MSARVLTVVICAAGPAVDAAKLTGMARDQGWQVQAVATPAAVDFIDQAEIQAQTGQPVRSQYSPPGSPRSLIPDAIIVAPATYNTINKWAAGISDTYALGLLAEATGMGVPTVVLPFVNSALASREAYRENVARLRREGVRILIGDGGVQPHQPRGGSGLIPSFPWHLALEEAARLAGC